MKNSLMNNRIFAIAIAAIMTTAFSTPAMANDEKDSLPVELKTRLSNVTHSVNLKADVALNTKTPVVVTVSNIKKKMAKVDFSWFSPHLPLDINPYDNMPLDFSWYQPGTPLNVNPFGE